MSEQLSDSENAQLGLFGGILEVSTLQSLNYLKNAKQQGLPLTLDPRQLYRGYPSNVINMGTCTMWQFVVVGKVQQWLARDRALTSGDILASGLLAGVSSAVFASPFELMMIQQQRNGGTMMQTATAVRPVAFRGLPCTMVREGLWSVGYLSLPPIIRGHLQTKYGTTEDQARIVASLAGAFVSSIISHPFDTVKTCMQGDVAGTTYSTAIQTARTLVAEGGFGALMRGVEYRYGRQFFAVFIIDKFRTEATPLLFPHAFEE